MYAIMCIYVTQYPPFKKTTLSIYDITCPLLMTSHALYMTYHLLFMISHSLYVWHHTVPVSLTSHTVCLWHTHFIWHHTVLWQHHHCVTSQPICLTSHPLYLCHHPHWINFINPSICMPSQPLCVWHHMHYKWHHIHNLGHHTTLWCQVHSIWPHFHCISVITPTLSMISQPLYGWTHIQYICDITSTIFITEYPLSMTSQHSVFMTQHSAYVWQTLHFRAQCPHSIKQNHSIYDVTSTSGTTKQLLYQTLHPLYLYHHTLCTDMSATFV